jgi:putative phosphoesterase
VVRRTAVVRVRRITPSTSAVRRIGLIADTHGLVRPEVHGALAGVELILHAGDVGGDEVLEELGLIAPVRVVRGNTDPARPHLPEAIEIAIDGVRIHVSHGHELGLPSPERLLARYAADVIVYGHTHQPLVTTAAGRLVVNPGAAGAQRFEEIPPSVATLTIRDGNAEAAIVRLV